VVLAAGILGAGLIAGGVAACRDATQVEVRLRTNAPFRPGIVTLLRTGTGTGARTLATRIEAPWLADGDLGTINVVPSSEKNGALSIEVVMGVSRPPEQCTASDVQGCIVARRDLSFVPNTRLRVPIVMHVACDGVLCGADQTCNYIGRCVSSSVDPAQCASEAGCLLEGDDKATAMDAGTGPDTGPALDAGPNILASDRIAAGGMHFCALRKGNKVKCWGRNGQGQLGLADTVNRGDMPGQMGDKLPSVDLGTNKVVTAVMAFGNSSCARFEDGTIRCWGAVNGRGATAGSMGASLPDLALGAKVQRVLPQAGLLLDNGRAWDLGAGRVVGPDNLLGGGIGTAANCFIQTGTAPTCVGPNATPTALGSNTGAAPDAGPTTIELGSGVSATEFAIGALHACALLTNGAVKCWGLNNFGQLGVGDRESRSDGPGEMGDALPSVPLGAKATQISIGYLYSCAVTERQELRCWGQAGLGGPRSQLGGSPQTSPGDAPPISLEGKKVLAVASFNASTCALVENDEVKCWGLNEGGALGLGDTTTRQPPDQNLPFPSTPLE